MSTSSWIHPLLTELEINIKNIAQVWDDMGVVGENYTVRQRTLSHHLHRLLEDMLDEETRAKQTLLDSINDLRTKIVEFEAEMGVPSFNFPSDNSLVATEKELFDYHKSLTKKAENSIREITLLLEQESILCSLLGEKPISVSFKHVPSFDQSERLAHLMELKEDVLALCSYLNMTLEEASSNCEMSLMLKSDFSIEPASLTCAFIASLEELRDNLDSKLILIGTKCRQLKDEWLSLRSRLKLEDSSEFNEIKPSVELFKQVSFPYTLSH
ncbi:unnamed protein product [Protopolystoma xenopodis]|uniref:Uncharacterized protein n=1 Tax=Protopolystoma xenopodis TaxID=117903 RepID=A0A3S5CS46_9PLAT|nr:unnamed protein product [Protopolystoma xenopodis]